MRTRTTRAVSVLLLLWAAPLAWLGCAHDLEERYEEKAEAHRAAAEQYEDMADEADEIEDEADDVDDLDDVDDVDGLEDPWDLD